MAYTSTRTVARFVAGESAPSPADALAGNPIVNQFGNIALLDLQEDGRTVILDTTVEPPVLRLSRAVVSAAMGYLESDGSFTSTGNYALRAEVSGNYTGPQSTLDLY
jgi:hypothetical protein